LVEDRLIDLFVDSSNRTPMADRIRRHRSSCAQQGDGHPRQKAARRDVEDGRRSRVGRQPGAAPRRSRSSSWPSSRGPDGTPRAESEVNGIGAVAPETAASASAGTPGILWDQGIRLQRAAVQRFLRSFARVSRRSTTTPANAPSARSPSDARTGCS
jgi:hypothetical protein